MSPRVPRIPGLPRLMRAAAPRSTGPAATTPTSKLGPIAPPDRNIATAPAPQADQGKAEVRTFAQTYFTKVLSDTQILYNGDRQWAKVTLTLETAGPVAWGVVQKLSPTLSGKGILLETDEPTEIVIPKGNRLYIVTASVNRIKVQVEALPWYEQITARLGQIATGISQLFGKK